MIGFFDSGFGGLTILKEVEKLMPEYSYIYLGDNARAPYGSRSKDEIYQFTVEGVTELFKLGAKIVVLACNTASAVALRRIQQEFLPLYYPGKKVLGIIIPTAEEINSFTKTGQVGVLSTAVTATSHVFEKEIHKVNPTIKVHNQVCPLFVPAIEAGEHFNEDFSQTIKIYISELLAETDQLDAVILGCTHYALLENEIKNQLPKNISVITQGKLVAEKLSNYFESHLDLKSSLDRNSRHLFLTTKNSSEIEKLASIFYGHSLKFRMINY